MIKPKIKVVKIDKLWGISVNDHVVVRGIEQADIPKFKKIVQEEYIK